jgi:hypothetical protein
MSDAKGFAFILLSEGEIFWKCSQNTVAYDLDFCSENLKLQ